MNLQKYPNVIYFDLGNKIMDANEFWNKIKKTVASQGRTFVWLCEQAGVSVQIMKNRIYKERIPDVDDTLKLLSVLGVTVEEFYGVESQFPVKTVVNNISDEEKIPVFEQLFSCGFGQFVPDTEVVEEYMAVPTELKRPKYKGHLGVVKIRGDSMEPTIHNGDKVICDDLGFDEDGVYAIIYKGKGFVKRLQMVQEGVKIISDNPQYEPMFASGESGEDFKVIGKVHYMLHKL